MSAATRMHGVGTKVPSPPRDFWIGGTEAHPLPLPQAGGGSVICEQPPLPLAGGD